jgi:hypothetical protein
MFAIEIHVLVNIIISHRLPDDIFVVLIQIWLSRVDEGRKNAERLEHVLDGVSLLFYLNNRWQCDR